MARWTLAGSTGSAVGPLALAFLVGAGLGWRSLYAVGGLVTLILVVLVSRALPGRSPRLEGATGEGRTPIARVLRIGVPEAISALRCASVLRRLALLECASVAIGALAGYLALFLVDAGGLSRAQSSLALAVWTGSGLLGNLMVIRLLARVRGLALVRWSAAAVLALYPAFLCTGSFPLRAAILALIGLLSSSWYAVLQAQVYAALPGRSGLVMTVGNIAGLAGATITLGLGFIAERFGLLAAMWLVLLGPLGLLIGIPRLKLSNARQAAGDGSPGPLGGGAPAEDVAEPPGPGWNEEP
jgi:FSR family fosmidomycin resistance protein-like MFS transporter